MKKWILFFIIAFIFQIKAYADPVILEKNNIIKNQNSSIETISTNSQIHIKNQKCYIENDLILKNNKKEKMTMGILYDGVDDLKVSVEGKEISIDIKQGPKNKKWYIWEIPNIKDKVNLRISYCKENILDSSGVEQIKYSLPENYMNYGKVTFIFDDGLDPQDIKIKDYEKYKQKNLTIIPKENQMIWTFYNDNDHFNIELYYKNFRRIEKEKLLEKEKRTKKEIQEIKDLGKKAYNAYFEGEYEKAISYINGIGLYKKNKDQEVSEYALRMRNFLDYYRGCIYRIQGNNEEAIYYFKNSGILYNRNLYDLANIYQTSGDLDGYTNLLTEIIENEEKGLGIRIWAEQEIDTLPNELKEKYGIKEKDLIKEEKNMKKEKFSFKGFLLFHAGITILLLVVFWNIKKDH